MQELEIESQQDQQNEISYYSLTRVVAPLGFLAYGGPLAHIALLKEKFVEKNKWVQPDEFAELFAICQSLPGPTSTQMVIAIGTMATKSILGGIASFLLFSLPSAIFMMTAGLLVREAETSEELDIPIIVQHLLDGFKCAAIGVIAQAAWQLSNSCIKDKFHMFLWFTSLFIYLVFNQTSVMILLLIIGALLNSVKQLYMGRHQVGQMVVPQEKEEQSTLNTDMFQGRMYLIMYIALFAFFVGLRYSTDSVLALLAEGFYRIGSLIIGGGHVVLPMIQTEFSQYIDEDTYWNGFSLISCMPGPMFNISLYVGAVVDGFLGGLVAWICLFLPAFLIIWGLLPYWSRYRKIKLIQGILQGISVVAVSFVGVAVVMLFQSAIESSGYIASSAISALALIGLFKLKGMRDQRFKNLQQFKFNMSFYLEVSQI